MLVKELLSAGRATSKALLEALAVAVVVRIADDHTRTVRMVIAEQADLRITGRLPSFSSLLDVLNVLSIHAEYEGESREILLTKLPGFMLRLNGCKREIRVRFS